MFGLDNFSIDRLSFWMGFIAGGLFWLLISRLRKGWSPVQEFINNFVQQSREKRLSGVDTALRQEVLKIAQRNHLASELFSLEEILIQPYLLAPPPIIDPEDPPQVDYFSPLVITYLPECPEFSAHFAPVKLTLPQALQDNAKIAIVGRAGSGKSTALAYLASAIARKDENIGILTKCFPIYIHILDIQLDSVLERDPADILSKAVSRQAPVSALPQLSTFLNLTFHNGNPILLLDGLDELSPHQLDTATQWLKRISIQIPTLRIMITASIDYINGLSSIGYEPLAVSGWTTDQVQEFVHRWGQLWNNLVAVNVSQQTSLEILDEMLVTGWIGQDPQFMTPLEWTCKIWGAYAGDLQGPNPIDAIHSFITRSTDNEIPETALAFLAQDLIREKIAAMDYSKAEKLLSNFKISSLFLDSETASESENESIDPDARQVSQTGKTITSGSRILDILINAGIMIEHNNNLVAFSNPVWAGYFAALQPYDVDDPLPPNRLWTYEAEHYHYDLAFRKTSWLDTFLLRDGPPLYHNHIKLAIWMRDTSPNHPNRTRIMRQVVQLLQNESVPYGVRLRLLASCSTSNDPALLVLFRQFLATPSPVLRSLAALGLGINQDTRSIKDLGQLLNDENHTVRYAACLALSAIDSPEAKSLVTSTLFYGDETIRLVAAEMLAAKPKTGHPQLLELIESEDLLVRRSAVYGISKINAPWVVSLLEKIAVEDGQWVVRNTAGQALENLQRPNPHVPNLLPPPYDTPWLIAFAARQGLGISKEDTAVPILIQVLNSGTHDEKLAALHLLQRYHDQSVIDPLSKLILTNQPEIRNAAFYTLWHIMISDGLVTEPEQFVYS
jgi:HEAT repeat protein/energy-coupling factor transporter ATP-binding protein EcfA2